MSPADLRAAGEALHGERWQSPLAEALAVNRRTIKRWVDGDWPIPDAITAEIAVLLAARQAQIARLLAG